MSSTKKVAVEKETPLSGYLELKLLPTLLSHLHFPNLPGIFYLAIAFDSILGIDENKQQMYNGAKKIFDVN